MNVLKNQLITAITLPTPFPVGDVNVYLVKGEALTLVDAGPKTEQAWELFKQKLKKIGYTPNDIEQVVITHHHPDHVGLLDFFPHELPVYGHSYNRPWLIQEKAFFEKQKQFISQLFTLLGVDSQHLKLLGEIDHLYTFSCQRVLSAPLKEGDEICGLSGWNVIETPGHAQSHIVLYNPKTCEVMGGDHLLKKISSNPLLEPPMEGDERPKPQLQYNESLKKLLQFPISVVYTGHGEPVYDAHKLIEHRLNRQHERAMNVLSLLNEKAMTAFDICRRLFPTAYEREFMLTMSETVGQLDYLEDSHLITFQDENGVRLYRRM